MKKKFLTAIFMLCAAASVWSQINFSYINASAVREGVSLPVVVKDVNVETRVGYGTAATILTMDIEPQKSVEDCDVIWVDAGAKPGHYRTICRKSRELDSIELSLWFNLPTDWVATDMWLWIDGKPVRAYVQDRTLAQQQYNQIVGRRMDPALLMFYGNGSYELRIFPASSFKSRKVAIEFRHTFDDDSLDFITAVLPLVFDTTYTYFSKSPILSFSATFSCTDFNTYNVTIPGVGYGEFSGDKALTLSQKNVFKLEQCIIYTHDPSDDLEYCWRKTDKLDSKENAGFSLILSKETVELEPEPEERIIVVDIRNKVWNWKNYWKNYYNDDNYNYWYGVDDKDIDIWSRAQKFAVLCIKNYVASNQKFNLILAGTTVKSVFEAPVSPTKENVDRAYAAILSALPSSMASTINALQEAIEQSPKGITILISDLYEPYDYYTKDWQPSEKGKSYDKYLESIKEIVQKSSITLFTISDEWRLHNIAYESGGRTLTGLRNPYYYYTDLKNSNYYSLPPLYETGYHGVSNISVSGPNNVSDIVFTTDNNYYSIWRGGPVDGVMLLKKNILTKSSAAYRVPYYYGPDSVLLRVAFKLNTVESPLVFTISGKMGGLAFTKKAKCWIPAISSGINPDDVQWAFRKTEYLANIDWQKYSDTIKYMGSEKRYHIATRQNALLALEPWMTLWEDTTIEQQAQSFGASRDKSASEESRTTSPLTLMPDSSTNSGTNIDDISIEELITGVRSNKAALSSLTQSNFAVKTAASVIHIYLPANLKDNLLTLVLYDIRGRIICKKTLNSKELSSLQFSWDLNRENVKLTRGLYTLKISSGKSQQLFKVSITK